MSHLLVPLTPSCPPPTPFRLSLFLPAWLCYLGQQLRAKDGEMGPGNRIDVSRTTVAYPQAMGESSAETEMGAVSHDAV